MSNNLKKLEAISDKVAHGMIDMNAIHNSTIWSIFNKDSESILSSINGNAFIKPKDKQEEMEFSKQNENENLLKLPSKGIPENPINETILGMTDSELKKMKESQDHGGNEASYTFDGSIFDF